MATLNAEDDGFSADVVTEQTQMPYHPDFDRELQTIRFTAETILIFLSVALNLIGLATVYLTHKEKKSIYHVLYINISISNIIACPLTWFWSNMPFFFPTWFLDNSVPSAQYFSLATLIRKFRLVMALSVSIQMNLSMLSLGVCQYFAVCRPLQSIYVLQKHRAYALIIISWVTFLVCLVTPFGVILCLANRDADPMGVIMTGVLITSNVYAVVITVIYVIMISLAILITLSLMSFSRRTYNLARSSSINTDMVKLKGEQRSCITAAALLASRTIITVPLTVYFLVEMNCSVSTANTAVFILSIVPCAKCIFDPFIYGSLMRDVKKTLLRKTGNCTRKERYPSEVATKDSLLTLDKV